ncbi:RHS repeat-associated core domain-containing protein [Treponema sp. OMZ 838]|uniref:RHS repeat-associated core domain-containing protein n=1 Tax=Treponema sp. OMZ 838 TaxID=1539298 RepID=UPI0009DE2EDA|nr:RHS repeat-associated core domain-containing protein [Treponema sp. OMZ 838]
MDIKDYFYQRNYSLPRTAIEAEILFAARIMQVRFLKRLSGKTPLKQNSSGEKIGAESAVLHFVFFIVIVNKMQQSAKEGCLLKRNTVLEVFPLTAGIAGSGKTVPFEKRRSRYKETAENKAEAYRVYVEHLFSACDAVDARIFSKGDGNMTRKISTTNLPGGRGNAYPKADLDYSLDYEYDPAYAHRLVHAGNRYYRYDANGNITAEKDGPFTEDDEFIFTYNYDPDTDVYGTDYGFGLDAPKETEESHPENLFAYRRNYTWNEKNLLTKSSDRTYTVHYRYGEDGQRALKYTEEGRSETLYFNNFYTIHIPVQDKNNPQGLRVHKHIFVGNSRLVTAMTHTDNNGDNAEQREKRYYYHSDHLGSAQFVTDWRGRQYEHIEYTPYGELWIEEVAAGLDKLPFRFTGKEMDEETGLYYYGARYLDPKYSRWLSGDPALSYYVDGKSNGSSGGIYNPINFNLYHYADNNPIRYIDPTGLEEDVSEAERQLKELRQLGEEMFYKGTINGINLYTENYEDGCYARATVIAGELEKLGFGVTDYSYVTSPVMPGVIKAEKAAKRDPSKVPDKDSEGNFNRYRFHVAATVIIDGKKYVVDPYYHKSWLSISEQEDWYSCQYPRGTSTQPAHDKSENLIGPPAMTSWKTRSSYTGTLSINEYAQGWLKNYDSVKRDNEKNKKNNNPYIWSGK